MNRLRIIFMGTPEFAVPSLEVLIENKFDVVAVVTAPDNPKGRGQKLVPSPVKECALKYAIPVLQPANLKSAQFHEELRTLQANLLVVVAFRMLPEPVWSLPLLGTINLHASLLPQYRGAAPINWAIIHGEKETGVTTFFLKHEIDTGGILFQEKEPIDENDNAGSLYDRLMKKGAHLVVKTVRAIESGVYTSRPQTQTGEEKHAPKIYKDTCEIGWTQTAQQVRNFVRGLSPYPSAWTLLNGKKYKIFEVSIAHDQKESKPGEFTTDNKNYLYVRVLNGWISVNELQAEGKRRMTIREFLAGNKI